MWETTKLGSAARRWVSRVRAGRRRAQIEFRRHPMAIGKAARTHARAAKGQPESRDGKASAFGFHPLPKTQIPRLLLQRAGDRYGVGTLPTTACF